MTQSPISCRVLGGTAALICVFVATACGSNTGSTGGPSGEHDIASLTTGTPTAGKDTALADATAPRGEDDRPQLRLDDSDVDRDRYWRAYATCLKEHGHKMASARGPYVIDGSDNSPTARAAMKTCANKLPRQPPELDPERNPHYAENWRANIKCLNAKGLKVVSLPDNSGWNYAGHNTMGYDEQVKVEKECTMEAFGGKKR
ncbi:hypothetical protein [Actinacidiphila glaucinigra]|uniref:hypothetical protein n=1 Tax=Actinacidiphila glaucinigra TaxID=235986 RepID=UPI002E3427DA|nr:hypothetical protein [Actinacidiphila glaucinigra]